MFASATPHQPRMFPSQRITACVRQRRYRLLFEEHEERIFMIIVWHVGSARLAFRRGNGAEGSLSAVECAAPVPEEFAGAAVQRTGRPILVAFESGQSAGHRPVDFAVILVETLGIVGHPVENDELGHWYLLCRSVKLSGNSDSIPRIFNSVRATQA